MSRAQQNQNLFNQAAAIYGEMGMGVPTFSGQGGGGRFTAHLQNAIRVGQDMLNDYRNRQQMQRAQKPPQSKPVKAPVKISKSGTTGIRQNRQTKSKGGELAIARTANVQPLQAGALGYQGLRIS